MIVVLVPMSVYPFCTTVVHCRPLPLSKSVPGSWLTFVVVSPVSAAVTRARALSLAGNALNGTVPEFLTTLHNLQYVCWAVGCLVPHWKRCQPLVQVFCALKPGCVLVPQITGLVVQSTGRHVAVAVVDDDSVVVRVVCVALGLRGGGGRS